VRLHGSWGAAEGLLARLEALPAGAQVQVVTGLTRVMINELERPQR